MKRADLYHAQRVIHDDGHDESAAVVLDRGWDSLHHSEPVTIARLRHGEWIIDYVQPDELIPEDGQPAILTSEPDGGSEGEAP